MVGYNQRPSETNMSRRQFLDLLVNGAKAGAVAAVPFGLASCRTPPGYKGAEPQGFWAKLKAATVDYGAIDDYVNAAFKDADPAMLIQGIVAYPADWTMDTFGRTPKALAWDMPKETWMVVDPANAETRLGQAGLWLAVPVTAPVVYGIELGGKTIEQVKERPLESIAHAAAGYAVGHAVYEHFKDRTGGGKSGGSGGTGPKKVIGGGSSGGGSSGGTGP